MATLLGYMVIIKAREILAGLLPIGVLLFILYLFGSTRYVLTAREMVVIFGPFHFRYPFSSMVSVLRALALGGSSNVLSVNFTFSSDHLIVRLKAGMFPSITISPSDQEHFLRLLRTRGVKVEP